MLGSPLALLDPTTTMPSLTAGAAGRPAVTTAGGAADSFAAILAAYRQSVGTTVRDAASAEPAGSSATDDAKAAPNLATPATGAAGSGSASPDSAVGTGDAPTAIASAGGAAQRAADPAMTQPPTGSAATTADPRLADLDDPLFASAPSESAGASLDSPASRPVDPILTAPAPDTTEPTADPTQSGTDCPAIAVWRAGSVVAASIASGLTSGGKSAGASDSASASAGKVAVPGLRSTPPQWRGAGVAHAGGHQAEQDVASLSSAAAGSGPRTAPTTAAIAPASAGPIPPGIGAIASDQAGRAAAPAASESGAQPGQTTTPVVAESPSAGKLGAAQDAASTPARGGARQGRRGADAATGGAHAGGPSAQGSATPPEIALSLVAGGSPPNQVPLPQTQAGAGTASAPANAGPAESAAAQGGVPPVVPTDPSKSAEAAIAPSVAGLSAGAPAQATAPTTRQASASKAHPKQAAGGRPASDTSVAIADIAASGPSGVVTPAAAQAGTDAAPRSRGGDARDGVVAVGPAGPAAVHGQAVMSGVGTDPSANSSHVVSILQSAAPSSAGMAAQALTPPTVAASPALAPPVSASGGVVLQAPVPAMAPTAAGSTTSAASPSPQTAHVAPASQVAPALLSLATSASGTHRLTLRLEPAELGTVQVRIDRPADAPAHVDVSVSRPETLTMMLRDQAQLQHTLDQAGVPAEGRTLSFHLSGQDADSLSRQAGGFDHAATNGETLRNRLAASDATDSDESIAFASPVPLRWQRVGLDITA